ncbi:MAG TPA: DUF885 domain-containing protein [Steroidobacteraceae bacterium]
MTTYKQQPTRYERRCRHSANWNACASPAWGIVFLILSAQVASAADPDGKAWVEQSNHYTRMLFDVQLRHSPEQGSTEGLARFDAQISDPRLADELAQRRELEAVLGTLRTARTQATDKNVQEDLDILQRAFELQFRMDDFAQEHLVTAFNPSESVFEGIKVLLDDQVPAERRPAALVRLRKYAGQEPGFAPYAELVKRRTTEQLAKPGVFFPPKTLLEHQLSRNPNYLKGIPLLFKKYHLHGWKTAFTALKAQLRDYDAWVRASLLPKARTDFREPPEEYALDLEQNGIDASPAEIATRAHAAFNLDQAAMTPLAMQVAQSNGFPSSDYRAVIAELKKRQITGSAIVPFYEKRLHEIEQIITTNGLVTLPTRPLIIRLASAAETVQAPSPHMGGISFLNNTGQRGEFVLPLTMPSSNGAKEDRYDDFTYDAVAWTLTAHEARPGHELQFDLMLEHGVSLARVRYALNSTDTEGWALYAEYIMQPFEPAEAQLVTLQSRLLRDARAFLDPELQSGKVTTAQAFSVLTQDVVLSHAFATEEIERYTLDNPGQAVSYFYGYTQLLSLRKETEAALGAKFNQLRFHDFVLGQGLLPPRLLRKALLGDFVPSQL